MVLRWRGAWKQLPKSILAVLLQKIQGLPGGCAKEDGVWFEDAWAGAVLKLNARIECRCQSISISELVRVIMHRRVLN